MTAPTPPRAFQKHHHPNQPQNFAEVLATDTRPVPDYVKKFGERIEGPYQVPARWYTDHAVFKQEVENLWKKKWQYACRTDHIPHKGDTYVYNIAGLSFVIVRVDEDRIKGYWNSCLHRGVPLRQCAGRVDRLQCPFHGFTWSLEGKNVMIPHPEDFPHIDPEKFSLPEVQVAVWQDFVMINPDLDAEPFETYIGNLDDQFERFPWTGREVVMHIAKVFACNWKALQEAFMESFHVLTTHPQLAYGSAGERCSDFGAEGNVSRGVLAGGHTSDYVPFTPDEEYIYIRGIGFWEDEEVPPDFKLPEGMTARQALAERAREVNRPRYGDLVDQVTDSEISDVYYYTVFPNFHPFGHVSTGFVYRFSPLGTDPDKSVMEVIFLSPTPEGRACNPPADVIWLDEEEEYVKIQQLGQFGAFISQDSSNLAGIMMGLQNSQTGIVNFARYHESKIRHFYEIYEKAMNFSAGAEVAALKAARGG